MPQECVHAGFIFLHDAVLHYFLAATMSVSLSPCSTPGQEPSFTLKDDEMELGLGLCPTK